MFKIILPVVIVFALHYVSANLYASLCAPLTLKGFLLSLIGTGSPVCTSLLSIVSYTSNTYNVALTGIIATFIGLLSQFGSFSGTAAHGS
jgi:hypothetical protein